MEYKIQEEKIISCKVRVRSFGFRDYSTRSWKFNRFNYSLSFNFLLKKMLI